MKKILLFVLLITSINVTAQVSEKDTTVMNKLEMTDNGDETYYIIKRIEFNNGRIVRDSTDRVEILTGGGGDYDVKVRVKTDGTDAATQCQVSLYKGNGGGSSTVVSSADFEPIVTEGARNHSKQGDALLTLVDDDFLQLKFQNTSATGTCTVQEASILISKRITD